MQTLKMSNIQGNEKWSSDAEVIDYSLTINLKLEYRKSPDSTEEAFTREGRQQKINSAIFYYLQDSENSEKLINMILADQ